MRAGMTLLEMIIALGIFTVLMAAALQCFDSAQKFINTESVQNDLVLEGRRIVADVVTDLSNSAWYIPPDADGDGIARPTDLNDLDALATPSADRGLRYYPYVNVQTATGRGTRFTAFSRTAANVPNTALYPPTLPAAHRAASRELIYLKVSTAPTAATPAQLQVQRVNFNDPVRTMAQWTAARDGITTSTVMTAVTGSGSTALVSDIPLAWESHVAVPDVTNPDTLRQYTYIVAPNPRTGRGRLERWYRNGTATPVRDRIVAEDVDRVVFDTYRTATGLNVNQVRMVVYLSREFEKQPGLYRTLRVEATVALRSTVDPEYSLNLGAWLGTGGATSVN